MLKTDGYSFGQDISIIMRLGDKVHQGVQYVDLTPPVNSNVNLLGEKLD